jgi:hypothetical protein
VSGIMSFGECLPGDMSTFATMLPLMHTKQQTGSNASHQSPFESSKLDRGCVAALGTSDALMPPQCRGRACQPGHGAGHSGQLGGGAGNARREATHACLCCSFRAHVCFQTLGGAALWCRPAVLLQASTGHGPVVTRTGLVRSVVQDGGASSNPLMSSAQAPGAAFRISKAWRPVAGDVRDCLPAAACRGAWPRVLADIHISCLLKVFTVELLQARDFSVRTFSRHDSWC